MSISFNEDSLKRHKATHEEIEEAIADPLRVEAAYSESKNGNPTTIWVGATLKGRLLEIGIEYMENEDHIYHASSCRNHYQWLYIQRRRR